MKGTTKMTPEEHKMLKDIKKNTEYIERNTDYIGILLIALIVGVVTLLF